VTRQDLPRRDRKEKGAGADSARPRNILSRPASEKERCADTYAPRLETILRSSKRAGMPSGGGLCDRAGMARSIQ